ncbi:Putative fumarate hydratase [Elusimicrobium minutum Pei191]|uniref:Putative fumarate hydratase n=1 Tax=Elusimicrobium minutum (strain Pei191) TaxID=445932 RepID=B2KBV3_ELUMP|nr:fumarate hydratase [Elusimicrobium minutum]ACC97857.1 Putative fumarate hydratase [Elusimicrobium minutum Pei191]
MRQIKSSDITKTIASLCKQANIELPNSTVCSFAACAKRCSGREKEIFNIYLKNASIAKGQLLPICQDTGITVVFLEIGVGVLIKGDLYKAVNKGVSLGYKKNFLRASVVKDPLFGRVNTKDNTPAVIYTKIVKGSKIKITVVPKGAGAENMSALKMFNPSAPIEEIKDFIVNTVKQADANPCPPVVVGVGVGGTFDYCAFMAKHALTNEIGRVNKDKNYASLEKDILKKINKLGIGPQGFGGKNTALAVFIEHAPCHMASLPVAVNIGCHVHRHAKAVL